MELGAAAGDGGLPVLGNTTLELTSTGAGAMELKLTVPQQQHNLHANTHRFSALQVTLRLIMLRMPFALIVHVNLLATAGKQNHTGAIHATATMRPFMEMTCRSAC